MRWQCVPTEASKPAIASKILDLLRHPPQPMRKVVLFTHWNPQTLASHLKLFKDRMPSWQWYRFYNTSLASLEKWRNSTEPSVLITTILSATEGTNFEAADTGIYLDYGSLMEDRARQCFGRIRRRTNPNPIVHNYLLYNREDITDYIRTRLNVYYATLLHATFMRKKDAQLSATATLLAKEGVEVLGLNEAEFLTLFALNQGQTPLPYKETDYSLPIFKLLQWSNVGW
jgi:hypothetical protein